MNEFISDLKQRFHLKDVVTQLIIVNVVIFVGVSLVEVILNLSVSDSSGFDTAMNYFKMRASLPLMLRQPWSLVTYMFLHHGVFHILFNMLVLYWMGQLFVEYLGVQKFLGVFFIGGICGALFYFAAYNIFPFFRGHQGDTLEGASAGINAVLVAVATLLPNYTVYLMFFGPVRLKYIAIVIVVLSVINLTGSNGGGEFSHLGGILFGFIFTKQLQQGNDLTLWFTKLLGVFSVKKKRRSMYVVTDTGRRRPSAVKEEEFVVRKKYEEEVIDSILDKISKSGYDSLSKEEKEILFRASDKKN